MTPARDVFDPLELVDKKMIDTGLMQGDRQRHACGAGANDDDVL